MEAAQAELTEEALVALPRSTTAESLTHRRDIMFKVYFTA